MKTGIVTLSVLLSQSVSHQSCLTLCNLIDCSTPGFPVLHYLLELVKLMSIESEMPSNNFILCCPLLLLPSVFPSIQVFTNELALPIRWPKYWSFSFSISPSNEYSALISFRIDWFDLLAVQWTLESILQHQLENSSLGFSPFYGPPFTSIHDSNHSFDYMGLCWQSDVSAFLICCLRFS